MELTFTSDGVGGRADELVDYLRGPRLWIPQVDYPDFDRWADKVHAQLKSEEKRAIVALARHEVVGAVVYQRHKTRPEALEIKNITVRPDMRGRFVAGFLLRNAEVEGAADYGVGDVIVDAKARNVALRAYLFRQGYRQRGVADLYGLGAGEDVVYGKPIGRQVRSMA
jgi:ribosomal protein S18 acetylase RimI-like enzyme